MRKKTTTNTKRKKRHLTVSGAPDRVLFAAVVGLVIFGLAMIASAGVIYSMEHFGDEYHFFKRQLFGVVLGLVALLILQRVDYHLFRRWAFGIYLVAVALLVTVLISNFGIEAYGASRWISLGPISFQPAEIVKLAVILYISAWCASKGSRKIADLSDGFVPFIVIISVIGLLILLQPDLGTFGMIVLIATAIYFVAGARIAHLATMATGGVMMLAMLIVTAPYRMQRLLTFMNPEADPQGAGYQIMQSLIAMGSGGLFGLGVGHSRQKALYLPEPVGDSIFAIIAEELGLIGGVGLVLMFGFLAWRIMRIANQASDLFGRLIAVGIGVWIVGQAFMNIAAISGLMPLTGIPLSFISYGGTSMAVMLAAIGIVLNISRQSQTQKS